jgi:hypothetical protein
VHGLNVVRVIVPPRAAHAAGADMVGDDVAVTGELLFADAADAVLSDDLPIEQLPHLPVGAQLAVSARVLGIVNESHAQLSLTPFFWDSLPATAGEGAVNWTELVLAESHGILLVGGKIIDELAWIRIVGKGNTAPRG